MAHSLDLPQLIVVGDSKSVISWMKPGEFGPWRLAHLVKEGVANSSVDDLAKSRMHRDDMNMGSLMPD